MQRPIFIIAGAIFILILILVWVYVLFFNTNTSSPGEEFSNLSLGDTTDNSIVDNFEHEPTVDVYGFEPLRQLTTKKVAGYREIVKNSSSTPEIYYVETGTGNIFSIDLETGEENRISKTTLPKTHQAVIAPNANYTLIQTGLGLNKETFIGEFSSSSDDLILSILEPNIIDFSATTDSTFLYAVQTNNSVEVKEYIPDTDTTNDLFIIPFREAAISWGESAESNHYFYPKATFRLEGYLYQANGGEVSRLPIDGYGLSATGNDDFVIYGKQNNRIYQNFTHGTSSELLPYNFMPEKCVFETSTSNTAICAVGFEDYDYKMPDSWYQGNFSHLDNIWEINTTTGEMSILINTYETTSRFIDILNLTKNNNRFYFINKNDGALWLFDEELLEDNLE